MHTTKKIFHISCKTLLPFRGIGIILLLLASWGPATAQIGNMSLEDYRVFKQMNIGTYSPALKKTNPSAYLELGDSLNSTKALLLPRGNKNNVSNPVKGLLFFNLPDSGVYKYNGTAWVELGGGGSGINNTNAGSGYRLLKPTSQEIKTLFPGYGALFDSTTNTDGITLTLDTVTLSTKYARANGTNATGTWPISITGNSETVTNGVYTTGSYANPSWITSLAWSKITGTPTTLSGYGITDALSTTLADGRFLVGNVSNIATAVLPTGDVTFSNAGVFTIGALKVATGMIQNSAVTLAKMADVATATVFYRKTAGTGAPEVNTLATLKTDLGLVGTNSGDQTITLTGDVTGSGTGSFVTTIANNAVTFAKFVQGAANTVVTNPTTGTADFTTTALAASNLLGRGSTGNIAAITVGGILSFSGTVLSATEVDGSISNELQTFASTSDATTHTVTLSNSGGSFQLVEGSNITLTTSGTGLDGIITIASTGGSGTPGGSDKQVQYNNAGAFGGSAGFETALTNLRVKITTQATTEVGMSINTIAAQTANIFEVYNSTPTLLTSITKDGYIGVGASSAVAPVEIKTNVDGSVTAFQITSPGGQYRMKIRETASIIENYNSLFRVYNSYVNGNMQIGGGNVGDQIKMTGSEIYFKNPLYLTEMTAPATPGTGFGALYEKADGIIYFKNDAGTEYDLTATGGGDMVLASVQTNSGAKTFLDATLLLRNVANTFNGSFTNTNTADRIYTLPDVAGTVITTGNLTGITATGTITSGTWNGTVVGSTYGGTGVNNGSSTITLAGNLITTGAFNTTFAVSGSNTITFPNASITVARIDAAQTFTGVQTFSSAPVISSITNTGTLTLPTVTSTVVSYKTASEASNATPTPSGDARSNDHYITALAAAATFAAPSGTPTNGNRLFIRIKDNGTAQTLAFNVIYRAGTDIALPTTTIISKTMYLGFVYNSADAKWDFIAYIDNIDNNT